MRLVRYVQEHVLLLFFFGILIIFIFFLDGQTASVEAFLSLCIVIYSLLLGRVAKKQRELPKYQTYGWLIFFAYILMQLWFSDSIATSLYALLRVSTFFIVFYIFVIYSTNKTAKLLTYSVIVYTFFSIVSALFVSFFPQQFQFVQPGSLLVITGGHHPIVIVCLCVFPLLFYEWIHTKRSFYFLLWIACFVISVFSFSRLALGIEAVITFLIIYMYRRTMATSVLIGMSILSVCVFGFIALYPYDQISSSISLFPQHTKSKLSFVSRGEYWRQTIEAIKERPIFGSGFGTFVFQSRRLENKAFSYSSASHNSILNWCSDFGIPMGVVLSIFCLYTYWVVGTTIRNSPSTARQLSGLYISCLALGLFSLVDIPFNYVVPLLLFASMSGVLVGQTTHSPTVNKSPLRLYIPIGLLLVLSGLYITSGVWIGEKGKPYLPIDTQVVYFYLYDALKREDKLPTTYLSTIKRLHGHNSRISSKLAQLYEIVGDTENAENMYRQSVIYDPFSASVYYSYMRFLARRKEYIALGEVLRDQSITLYPHIQKTIIMEIPFTDPVMYKAYVKVFQDDQLQGYAFIYYLLGAQLLSDHPDITKQLWNIALLMYPDYGHFHVEYASLLTYVFNDKQEAERVLRHCQQIPSPKGECQMAKEYGLQQPRALEMYIQLGR